MDSSSSHELRWPSWPAFQNIQGREGCGPTSLATIAIRGTTEWEESRMGSKERRWKESVKALRPATGLGAIAHPTTLIVKFSCEDNPTQILRGSFQMGWTPFGGRCRQCNGGLYWHASEIPFQGESTYFSNCQKWWLVTAHIQVPGQGFPSVIGSCLTQIYSPTWSKPNSWLGIGS